MPARPFVIHCMLRGKFFVRFFECCAEVGGKILSVHSVRSIPDVLAMVERHLPQDRGTVVPSLVRGHTNASRRRGGPWLFLLCQCRDDAQ